MKVLRLHPRALGILENSKKGKLGQGSVGAAGLGLLRVLSSVLPILNSPLSNFTTTGLGKGGDC